MFTDNNPLTYVLSSTKLDAVGHCWVAALAVYDFSLVYKQGHFNQDADALSQIQWPLILKELDHEVISAACQVVSKPSTPVMDTLSLSEALINEHFNNPMLDGLMQMIQDNDWAIMQDQDTTLTWLKSKVMNGTLGSAQALSQCPQVHPYLHHRHQFCVKSDILYRAQKSLEQKKEWLQLVLPEPFHCTALQYCHDQLGHHGVNHTLALLYDWFYWPQMDTDVR